MNPISLFEKQADSPIWKGIWFLFFFLLPITSMPAVVNLVHSDVVAAPSGLILAVLLIGWVFPKLLSGEEFSENAIPLFCFVIVSLISTAVSFFYKIPIYKQSGPLRSSVSAIITVFIGAGFFIAVMLWVQEPKRLRLALQALNWSGALVLIWTLMQAFFWYTTFGYPQWMKDIQYAVSVGSLYRQRFVGFALEPSWLAHQLNLLYLPFWFGATVTGYSAHSKRFGKITFERILFVLGAVDLYLTLSRVGLAAFILSILFYFIWRIVHFAEVQSAGTKTPKKKKGLILLGFFVLIPFILLFILWTLTKLDFRMAELFTVNIKGRNNPLMYLAEKLSLASRFSYWEGGLKIFSQFPILGVGLGHAGFYLPQNLSAFALRLVEVRDLLFRSEVLLNIKSLWIRILAENGIIGFSFFVAWLVSTWRLSRRMMAQSNSLLKTAGWMGCFSIVAFLLEGFSLDTFALPYLWVSMGLVGGVSLIPIPNGNFEEKHNLKEQHAS